MENIIFLDFCEKLSVVAEEYPQGLRKGEDELSMWKTQQDFLIEVFGKEERSFLAAGGTQIKPLAGERAEVVVTAVRIAAADVGYTLNSPPLSHVFHYFFINEV